VSTGKGNKNTKERILYTAIEQFNQSGTGKVSTNHIAAAANISPGNLYYHFRNKEQIIRGILDMMYAEWGQLWKIPQRPTLYHFKKMIFDTFRLEWKYRFFYRELVILSRNDPVLGETHQKMQNDRFEEQGQLVQAFIDTGVIREPSDPNELHKLLTVCWVFTNYWISFLESNGMEASEEQLERGLEHILLVLSPYINHSS
jgi:AcrR family transcriptional regulator